MRSLAANVCKGWALSAVLAAAPLCHAYEAVVDAAGRLIRGDATSVPNHSLLGAGRYEVVFPTDIRGCSYTATIGDSADGYVYNPGLIFTGNHDGRVPYLVYVETKNPAGGLQDYPFHLRVNCATTYAVVDPNGALFRGDATGALRYGPGRYEVSFAADVSGCSYTASIGDVGNGVLVTTPGLVFTAGGHGGPNGVYIETKNLGGGLADYPFHLSVNCVSRYGVVDMDGTLVRGDAGSAFRYGPGRYEVMFADNVSGCNYTATIGDPANTYVYNPGLVFTAGGHSGANGVYIETKNLAGGLADYPFHLGVTCTATRAVVDADGTLVRGDANAVFRYGPGRYEVSFPVDVSGCSYTASIGDPANAYVYNPGLVFTAGGHGGPNGVYIETKNLDGGLADYPFHLAVNCISRYAVVDVDGTLVRGDAVTAFRYGPGRYEVSFSGFFVGGCSYTATIGDPANAYVYNPGLVFTAGGHSGPNGVYIETKNLAGGLQDYPFHLSVNCDGSVMFAVVDADGTWVRGGAVEAKRYAPGVYELGSTFDLSGCSFIATIGDPASGYVYNPGLVFTAGGHTGPKWVYIETKNLAGGLADYPFHLQGKCGGS